jgi:phosphatidate cytidylyltransferase
MFWRRALSVVVLVPLIILIIYWGDWFYLLLISAAVLMMQIEYCRLAGNFGSKLNPVIPVILTVAFCLFAFRLDPPIEKAKTSVIMSCFLVVVFIYAFTSSIFRGKVDGELRTVTLKLTGILTIGWVFGYHCILLRKADDVGMQLIFWLIGTIWCSDTGAYLIGRAVGKHKLSTPISPRKTVEGTIAGFVVGTLTSMALGAILLPETLSLANAAFIGLLLSILGQLGDLSVSLMKRTAGVKDSGDFIPGHGGFLDRCDSLIFSAPSLYYYLALTGYIS